MQAEEGDLSIEAIGDILAELDSEVIANSDSDGGNDVTRKSDKKIEEGWEEESDVVGGVATQQRRPAQQFVWSNSDDFSPINYVFDSECRVTESCDLKKIVLKYSIFSYILMVKYCSKS